MATPERPNLDPYIEATKCFMDRIAEIEDEMDTILNHGRKIDIRKFRDLEEDFQTFSNAFDALIHDHNIPFVVSFLRSQARKLGRQKTDPDYFKRSQHLRCLAADLNRAA